MTKNIIILKGIVYQSALEFLWEEGFVGIPYPGITNATGSCEAVSNVFTINESTFQTLSQTVQLHLEHDIITYGLPRMFSTNRSYRRNNSAWVSDGRHLNDFELLETEALDTDLNWLLQHCQNLLNNIFIKVLNISSRYGLLTPEQHHNLYMYYEKGFKVMTYTEGIEILQKYFNIPIEWGDDLKAEHEQKLVDFFGQNLMITHYPEKIKFFNMMLTRNCDPDRQTCECVDVILKNSGESIGGSVREYDYEILRKRLYEGTMLRQLRELKKVFDSKPEEIDSMFEAYLDLFKNKTTKKSGMGLGFGRVLQFIIGSREIIQF